IAFISRVPIAHHEWHYPRGAKHSFLEIIPEGSEARIYGLHLRAMFSKWSERGRAREIRMLLDTIKQHEHGFHLLVGDFNTLAPGEVLNTGQMPRWIRAMVWLSGRDIQRETVGVVLGAGYADGYRSLHPDDKGYTFPAWEPHVRLDYLFLPARFKQRLTACEVIKHPPEVAQASDHFPLLAHLEL
ncbi:MAG: hypothetical protein JOZ52_12590, partial [Acidobacteria bacterium]|nr:hypothetical protein [Acidobacteriota bacterium]